MSTPDLLNIPVDKYIDKNRDWLLNSDSYTRHKTITDLLDIPKEDDIAVSSKKELLKDPLIVRLINESSQWFPSLPKRHDDATMSHYKLRMLADFGLDNSVPEIQQIIKKLKSYKKAEMFAIRQQLPDKNISKDEEWFALPCDSPLLTYILIALGDKSEEVNIAVENLKKYWLTSEGWFCNLFFVSSQFKKLRIGCPIAGLMSLEVFSMYPELHSFGIVKNAFEPLDFHRNYNKSIYYFGRSKRFWSFKYPFVWYNAFYMAEVLTRFKRFKNSDLLKEIIIWIEQAFDNEGRITATSMFRSYKEWDFANKKSPSPWLTFLAYRILKRYYAL